MTFCFLTWDMILVTLYSLEGVQLWHVFLICIAAHRTFKNNDNKGLWILIMLPTQLLIQIHTWPYIFPSLVAFVYFSCRGHHTFVLRPWNKIALCSDLISWMTFTQSQNASVTLNLNKIYKSQSRSSILCFSLHWSAGYEQHIVTGSTIVALMCSALLIEALMHFSVVLLLFIYIFIIGLCMYWLLPIRMRCCDEGTLWL